MYVRVSAEHTRAAVSLLPSLGSDMAPAVAVEQLRAQFAARRPRPIPQRPALSAAGDIAGGVILWLAHRRLT